MFLFLKYNIGSLENLAHIEFLARTHQDTLSQFMNGMFTYNAIVFVYKNFYFR
jgi:hypothetical protein